NGDESGKIRQIEVLQLTRTSVDDSLIGTPRRIGKRFIECRETAASSRQEAQLVAAAHCRLTCSKPRDLPGTSDCGANVVPVFWPHSDTGFLGFRSDKLQLSDVGAPARVHPILKAASGDTE